MSPNEALLGYRPRLFPAQPVPTSNESAEKRISILHQKRAQATAAINHAAKTSSTPKDVFKLNDQVWLESKHLALPHQSKKLAPKRVGPFRITKVISPVVFQLDLPPSWRIHDVFHTSLLTSYCETTAYGPNFIKPPPDLIDGEEEYEVEAVLNHHMFGRRRQVQYLIKWKGYPSSDNTWEAVDDVHADDLTREYHRRHPLEPFKSKVSRGTKKLACTLQLLTSPPSPTQKLVNWLLSNSISPIKSSPACPPTPRSLKDKPSASIDRLRSTSPPP